MSRKKITAAVTAVGIALFAGAADAETIPERLMADLSRDFQLQGFQAAGIVGNLARETGNFRFMQELNPIVEGSRGGIGYSQWTGSRRVAFEAYAGSLENQLTYEVNYGYLKKELNEDYAGVIKDVRGSKNLWEATVLFMRGYLKPKKNENNIRVSMNYANAYLRGDYSGAGCQLHHEVRIDGRRMMVAACPDTSIRVAGENVDMVLASAPRPQPKPAAINAQLRVADAGMDGSIRPPVRPEQAQPAHPAKDYGDEVYERIMIAMNAARDVPKTDPGPEETEDPMLAWDPFYARKEDEPDDFGAIPDDDSSYVMTA